MRTIKFRGKRIDNGEWIYGLLTIRHDNKCFIQKIGSGYGQDGIEIDIKTLNEFTGLKDKNGKEIYEGDILAYMSNDFRPEYKGNWVVEFEDGTFIAKCKDGDSSQWLPYWSYDIYAETEIIGNIYENPELLK